MSRLAAVLRYPGSKWSLAPWIVASFPPHQVYVEAFLGSGAVFFTKPPVQTEVLNDLAGEVVTLFRVLRDPASASALAEALALTPWARLEWEASSATAPEGTGEVERARRFLVRAWQSHGARVGAHRTGWRHDGPQGRGIACTTEWKRLPERCLAVVERLRDAEIECRPAVDVIRRHAGREVLVYADPPYLGETRGGATRRGWDDFYRYEMKTQEEHEELLDVLRAHPGPVVLSGYASDFYEQRLRGWTRLTRSAVAEHGRQREEVLWLNRAAERGQLPLAGT